MAKKHSMGFLLCLGVIHLPRLGSCLACWGWESSFQTRNIILPLEESQNAEVFTLNYTQSLSPESRFPLTNLWYLFSWDIPTPKHHKSLKSSEGAHPEFRTISFHQTHQTSYTSAWEPAPPVNSKAAQTMAAPCCVQLGSPPPVSASNALQMTLEEGSQNLICPRSNPWRANSCSC